MKKNITLLLLLALSLVNAQAFKGKEDFKAQVGASLQSKANGIHVSGDYGIGENMSVGVGITYILGVSGGEVSDIKPFLDKFDLKARFNANIGNVLKIDDKLDVYPGLDLGLKNFGAHLGTRYFFTDGFGVYLEFNLPLAKYNGKVDELEKPTYFLNNQFMTNFGVSFNL